MADLAAYFVNPALEMEWDFSFFKQTLANGMDNPSIAFSYISIK